MNLFNAITRSATTGSVVVAELAVGAVVFDVEAAVVEVVEGLVRGVAILLTFVLSSVYYGMGYKTEI